MEWPMLREPVDARLQSGPFVLIPAIPYSKLHRIKYEVLARKDGALLAAGGTNAHNPEGAVTLYVVISRTESMPFIDDNDLGLFDRGDVVYDIGGEPLFGLTPRALRAALLRIHTRRQTERYIVLRLSGAAETLGADTDALVTAACTAVRTHAAPAFPGWRYEAAADALGVDKTAEAPDPTVDDEANTNSTTGEVDESPLGRTSSSSPAPEDEVPQRDHGGPASSDPGGGTHA